MPPGMDELFSLLQIKRHHESGRFDVVIVDCAPTGETLRLLGFPDIAHWWLEKVFPWERRLLAAAKPIARMIDVEVPDEDVLGEVQRLVRHLIAMNEILRDRTRATIRLVINPDRMVIKEAQRTFTYLNLYGYLTDAVVVNRVFPDELAGRLLRRVARPSARAPRGRARRVRPAAAAGGALLRGGGGRPPDARPPRRRAVRRLGRAGGRAAHRARPRDPVGERDRHAADQPPLRRARGRGAEEGRPGADRLGRALASGRSSSRRRSPGDARRARSSRTVPSR